MTISSWGGAYQAMQQAAYAGPYAAATGINWSGTKARPRAWPSSARRTRPATSPGISSTFSPRTASGSATKDWFGSSLRRVARPAPDGNPASEDLGSTSGRNATSRPTSTRRPSATAPVSPSGTARCPPAIRDIFDIEKFPGKRALEKRPINNLEWALICSDVPADQVYDTFETDAVFQKALDKLDTIKAETVWWSAGAQPPQLLADKEVAIGSTYNGRLFSVIEEQKQPVAMLWDYEVLDIDGFVVPADLPEDRLNRVKHFLRYATDTQRLADQAKFISYGPARDSSQPFVGKHADLAIEMAPQMPTSPRTPRPASCSTTLGGPITATSSTPASSRG